MKKGTKLLGYGIFCGAYWGSQAKNWQFEKVVGIQPTREDAASADRRILHCLHRETRRIYSTTMLNIGHHSSPRWINAKKFKKQNP